MPATGSVASSTIAQPVGSQTKPSVLTRSLIGIRQLFFTSNDLADPEKLYQVIARLQSNLIAAIRPLAENPTLAGVLVTGVVFVGGDTQLVSHGLGRAFAGFYCVDAAGTSWAGKRVASPTGTTAAQMIALTNPTAGTYSFWVF